MSLQRSADYPPPLVFSAERSWAGLEYYWEKTSHQVSGNVKQMVEELLAERLSPGIPAVTEKVIRDASCIG